MRRMQDEAPEPWELEELMEVAGASLVEVAHRLGVSDGAVRKWLSGDRDMGGALWWFLRADLAVDIFGKPMWPPPTLDEFKKRT